jgi:hypothetical protein
MDTDRARADKPVALINGNCSVIATNSVREFGLWIKLDERMYRNPTI